MKLLIRKRTTVRTSVSSSFLIGMLLVTQHATAKSWSVDLAKGDGNVSFEAVGRPSALKINGKGASPQGTLTVTDGKITGKIEVDLRSMGTGISLRDDHMKNKYLEVGKFPKAQLEITNIKLPNRLPAGEVLGQEVPFQGNLTIHGVTKPVKGVAKINSSGSKITVEAIFKTNISNHGIDVPSFAGVTVADEVNVVVQFTAPISNGETTHVAGK